MVPKQFDRPSAMLGKKAYRSISMEPHILSLSLSQMQALMAAITPMQIPKEDLTEEELKEFEVRGGN